MKRVYSHPNLSEADLVRSILEGQGIDTHMRNEYGAHTAGAAWGAMIFAWPEIWVREEDYDLAKNIIEAL